MNPSHNAFDPLKKILHWKNGEQPYPGYFNHFSTQVTSRIRAQESIRQPSGWMKFLSLFDARPVMATAYALVVFGMMLFAFSFSELEEPVMAGGLPPFQAGLVNALVPNPETSGMKAEATYRLAPQFTSGQLFTPSGFAGETPFSFQIQEAGYHYGESFPMAAVPTK